MAKGTVKVFTRAVVHMDGDSSMSVIISGSASELSDAVQELIDAGTTFVVSPVLLEANTFSVVDLVASEDMDDTFTIPVG